MATASAASLYNGGSSNACAFYYPFDIWDPRWVVRGFLLATSAAVAGTPLNIAAGLVEANAALLPTVTPIGASQTFDLTNPSVVVTDTALSSQGTPRCIKAEFTVPVVFAAPPRRVFLCVVYQPNWTAGSNQAYVTRPVIGAAQFKQDMAAAYAGTLPVSAATASVVTSDYFLSFDPYLHLDTGS